jgi:hypothetical protein
MYFCQLWAVVEISEFCVTPVPLCEAMTPKTTFGPLRFEAVGDLADDEPPQALTRHSPAKAPTHSDVRTAGLVLPLCLRTDVCRWFIRI